MPQYLQAARSNDSSAPRPLKDSPERPQKNPDATATLLYRKHAGIELIGLTTAQNNRQGRAASQAYYSSPTRLTCPPSLSSYIPSTDYSSTHSKARNTRTQKKKKKRRLGTNVDPRKHIAALRHDEDSKAELALLARQPQPIPPPGSLRTVETVQITNNSDRT